jgi:hypothetical protein
MLRVVPEPRVRGKGQVVGGARVGHSAVARTGRAYIVADAARLPGATVLLHHQVDDPGGALRRELRRGIGDHLHPLHRIRRQGLQRLGGALAAEQGAGLAVHEDGDVGVAAQGDIALHVHLDRRDVLQGVADRSGGGLQVLGDTVAAPVDGGAESLLRGAGDGDPIDGLGPWRGLLGRDGFRRRGGRGLNLRHSMTGGHGHGGGQQDAQSIPQSFPRLRRAVYRSQIAKV